MSSDERSTRGTNVEGAGAAARGGRNTGGEQRPTGAPHRPEIDAMSMNRLESYRPPHPTIWDLMEEWPR